MVVPIEGRRPQSERDAPVDLLGLEVEHGGALFHCSSPGRGATDEEKGFGESRLAAPAMTDEGDVANFLG